MIRRSFGERAVAMNVSVLGAEVNTRISKYFKIDNE